MAGKELIVDDEYCSKMANYFQKQGEKMDKTISDYISVLISVRDNAICSGETHDALCTYIEYAQKLKGQIKMISKSAKTISEEFVSNVDEEDQFLF